MKPGLLALADGSVFRGVSVGAPGVATGEVVFNTAMTGYQEIVTDPSYAGQVVTFTSPHIGNYGTSGLDDQGDAVHARGVIVRSMAGTSSSWRAERPLADYLTTRGVVTLSDVDTRRLTRHVVRLGSMPAALGSDVDEGELVDMARGAPVMTGQDLVATVTTDTVYRMPADGNVGTVVVYDFGVKRDILTAFTSRGVSAIVVPASTPAGDVLAMKPDGVFLSNGPGDPEPLTASTTAVREMLGAVPIFGICLGHQILGLALGLSTYKLPFGHHGGNHPVRRLSDATVSITAQNHGFSVNFDAPSDSDVTSGTRMRAPTSIETEFGTVIETHQNLNDATNEGLACHEAMASSVQFHPEAAPGPRDAMGLFDEFSAVVGAHA
ncbi:MAG: glutamine-hydrolyzing carbamoyl-phosphate synthase small subunit [Actinomycetota bacterium]